MRSSAEREVEPSRLAGGRARSTPVCAVLIALSHLRLPGKGFVSSSYTGVLYLYYCRLAWAIPLKTCDSWLNWKQLMECVSSRASQLRRRAGLAVVFLLLFTFVYATLTYSNRASTHAQLSSNFLRILSLVSIAVASFTRSRLYNICLPKWFPRLGSPSSAKPAWLTSPNRLAWRCTNNNH
jgi:hypothetical protein